MKTTVFFAGMCIAFGVARLVGVPSEAAGVFPLAFAMIALGIMLALVAAIVDRR